MEAQAQCYMCSKWEQDKCNGVFGRCAYQEANALEGVLQGEGPTPQWIEVWMDGGADSSACDGLTLTEKGRRELALTRDEKPGAEDFGDRMDREWAKRGEAI